MRKKIITSAVLFIVLIMIFNIVQANALEIQITLPNNLRQIDITDAKMKDYYEQNHIYLHAINESQDESVMITQLENELTKRLGSLKGLSQQNCKAFIEEYNKAKLQDGQSVLKQETYEKDDMMFIDTVYEKTVSDKTVQTEEYYTIHDGKALIVSASFLNKDVDSLKIRQMMDSVKILAKEDKSSFKEIASLLIIPIMAIGLGVIYFVKEKRNKVELEADEKVTVLNHVTEYMKKMMGYSRYRGILILFAVTIGLNVINLLFGVIDEITSNNWMGQELLITKIHAALSILQNVIQLIGVIYIAYRLMKKEAKTIKKIQSTFITMLIGVIILTISRLIIQAVSIGINESFITYITYETTVFAKSMIYILIWYFYFRNSIRVSVYYKEKSLEQIITNPKKGYQNNLISKKIMEYKIIEYFKNKKALDYTSGIYINKLPKEYASSLSLSDLNSMKVIRLKKAKYYLSMKDLESPKSQKRKEMKTVSSIIIIYLFIQLILYIL